MQLPCLRNEVPWVLAILLKNLLTKLCVTHPEDGHIGSEVLPVQGAKFLVAYLVKQVQA